MSRLLWRSMPSGKNFLTSVTSSLTSTRVHWGLIGVGIVLRLTQYLINHSLWIDESFLALNIINRSFVELLQPLDYNQAAPVGFLMLEKLAIEIFGSSEYALRLVPFLSGIISLFLFYRVSKHFLKSQAVTIALGLFVLSDRLIYYSAEVKQYSSDVAIALTLYLAAIALYSQKLTAWRVVFFGVFGAVALWFSHPSVFVLAGAGITLLISCISKKEWSRVIGILKIGSIWTISFATFYFVSIQSIANNDALQSSWSTAHNSFMPLLPSSLKDIRWYVDNFFNVFNTPVGLYLSGIAALTFIIGCVSIFADKKENFFIIISPILITLLASGLHKYPFKGQLLLFIIPSVLLLVAEGARKIVDQTRHNSALIGITLIALLFFHPLYFAASSLKNPYAVEYLEQRRVREDIKPVLNYVQDHQQDGDVLYLYYASQYAFKYYEGRYSFNYAAKGEAVWPEPPEDWFAPALPSYPPQLIVGRYSRDDWQIFVSELKQMRGNERVWVIFSHVRDRRSSFDEEDVFLHELNKVGKQLDTFKATEASVYLYDLR